MKVRNAPHPNPLPKGAKGTVRARFIYITVFFAARGPSTRITPPDKTVYPQESSPMHNPSLWQVIGIGIVLGHAVIPNRNIIWLPAPAHLKLRFSDMGE